MNSKRLYQFCLRLYPQTFRNEFGDEMLDIFQLRLEETNAERQWFTIIQEVTDALWNALSQRIQVSRKWHHALADEWRALYHARWIIRIASVLNVLFFMMVSLESYSAKPSHESLLMPILFGLQLNCVIVALRWERLGGLIMLTTTITIASMIFLSLANAIPGYEMLSFLAAVLWATPFGGFALAYLVIGQKQFDYRARNFYEYSYSS